MPHTLCNNIEAGGLKFCIVLNGVLHILYQEGDKYTLLCIETVMWMYLDFQSCPLIPGLASNGDKIPKLAPHGGVTPILTPHEVRSPVLPLMGA